LQRKLSCDLLLPIAVKEGKKAIIAQPLGTFTQQAVIESKIPTI
jgi:hypothetical protein